MTRFRVPLLVLFSAASLVVSCDGRDETAPTVTSATIAPAEKPTMAIKPPIRVRKPEVEPLKFPPGIKIIRVPNVLGSQKLPCKPTKTADSGEPGTGGFACTTIFPINLMVKTGESDITVHPRRLGVLLPGDCIRFRAINSGTDGAAAMIDRINFIDTRQEADGLSKTEFSPWPVDDICMEGSTDCYYQIALDDGLYVYEAHVSLDGDTVKKRSDPEIEVGCSAPNCGDPGDMVNVH